MILPTWADTESTWADTVDDWAYPGILELDAKFEWSPTTNPGASPVWEDITERVRSGRIFRGRQSEFDRTSAGRLTLEVDNRDRRFDPEYYANAQPNKRIRVTVGTGADKVGLFDGWIDAMPQLYDPPNDATIRLTATDGFKMLAKFELDEIYGSVVRADSPWAWFRFTDDLPRVTQALDASGNGRHGLYKGTPTTGQPLVADGPGKSLRMDGAAVTSGTGGSGDHVSSDGMVLTSTLTTAPLTIECWVRTGKYGTNSSFICGQTNTPGSGDAFNVNYGFVMDNSAGTVQFTALVGNGNAFVQGGVIRDDGPHHLVGTIDGSRVMRLYVDGVQVGGNVTPAGSGLTIDGTGAIRVGKPPVNYTGTAWGYRPYKGEASELAVYSRALSGAEILEHYQAGAAPWATDTTGSRVTRLLNLVGWRSTDRTIETGSSILGAATDVEGKTALDHLLAVETTEQGRFFIDGNGKATFFGRVHEVSTTAEATFTDADHIDLAFDFSDANLVNDSTVTRNGGLPQRATDSTSISKYWRHSEELSGLLYSTDNESLAMAQWRVANYSTPTLRPTKLSFTPQANMAELFPRVMTRELGDRIEVVRGQLTGSDVTVDAVIEGIEHSFTPREWQVLFNLSPLIYGTFGGGGGGGGNRYWTLNHATYGQLDNNNRLSI